ncbi:type IV pilin [Candidatus Pacearchaeota archaeon]|nr:type IV pilin [Candidatus Pacearchaeota archaeon]
MKKKGLSDVISTVLLITLTVVLIGVVWVIVGGIVKDKTIAGTSCLDLFEKVKLNEEFTCYDAGTNTLRVSVDITDLDVDGILFSVSDLIKSKSFEIKKEPSNVDGVSAYDSSPEVSLPNANDGKDYLVSLSFFGITNPTSVKIAPKINGNQCEVSDSLDELKLCRS